MYDVGRITSKPHSVGGLPNSESGLEIQPVARATGQGGWQRLLQGTSVTCSNMRQHAPLNSAASLHTLSWITLPDRLLSDAPKGKTKVNRL
jgi:hypothetical protein